MLPARQTGKHGPTQPIQASPFNGAALDAASAYTVPAQRSPLSQLRVAFVKVVTRKQRHRSKGVRSYPHTLEGCESHAERRESGLTVVSANLSISWLNLALAIKPTV